MPMPPLYTYQRITLGVPLRTHIDRAKAVGSSKRVRRPQPSRVSRAADPAPLAHWLYTKSDHLPIESVTREGSLR